MCSLINKKKSPLVEKKRKRFVFLVLENPKVPGHKYQIFTHPQTKPTQRSTRGIPFASVILPKQTGRTLLKVAVTREWMTGTHSVRR